MLALHAWYGGSGLWWGAGAVGQADTGHYDRDVWHWLDVPGFGLGGFLGYYWRSYSGTDRWKEQLFVSQTSTMIELTGLLITAELSEIQSKGTQDSFLDKTNRDQQFGGN